MKEVLILAAIELVISIIFFGILIVLRKRDVGKNVGWFIIALMVVLLNRAGDYLGYDSVTVGAADFIFLLILIPGYFIVNSYIDTNNKNGNANGTGECNRKSN